MEFETVSVALNMKMREHVMAFFFFFFDFVNRYSGQWLNNIKCLYFKKKKNFLIINEKT